MVTTTKTPGAIYPNGSAVPKADIRTWMTEMQTGTNAELTDLRNGRLWHSSSTNLSAQTPPPGTNQIIVANNSGTFNWRRLGSAPNPVNPAIHAQTADAAWWYLSEDTPAIKARVSAVETDLPNGRVWRYARNDLTPVGATPPTGTQMIAVHKTTGSGQADWVRRAAARRMFWFRMRPANGGGARSRQRRSRVISRPRLTPPNCALAGSGNMRAMA
ncbi:hypothetical protein JCM7686_2621 [Paracoccus aminophilus JCM 7686]|uniref:Uncharacterized protein n=1 Tax=Paracoccus aminophilus JCM 7686 TaxID=1367847 RepID=S5YDY8_PARAH|nr:hypothetical protein JCM7686_2621 [Paracoccus aminophilus JCM 7686]